MNGQVDGHSGRFCIVGAGLSGAVIARALAEAGQGVLVVDERDHIGGNCHTARDAASGIMLHTYGPHIFHTDDDEVWQYVNRFATMRHYPHRVRATTKGRVFSLPLNLLTINQVFGKTFGPAEARAFVRSLAEDIAAPRNFEEQALSMVGRELYEAFFEGYTRKQWGLAPTQLPASILKRLPLRFDYNDSYFAHRHQGIPEHGYTAMVERILDVPNVEIRLKTGFEGLDETFAHVIYTGPLDRYFGFSLGRLPYRTLHFEKFQYDGDYQGTAVMNYCDADTPFTRITEHKHFAPWELRSDGPSVCYREFSASCGENDIPYYPIRLADEERLLSQYVALADETPGVTFVGRLGTFRYLDMDVTIREALGAAEGLKAAIARNEPPPAFFTRP